MTDYYDAGIPLLFPSNDHRGSLAEAVQDVANRTTSLGWNRLTTIYDRAVVIPATAGEVLFDDEVDLLPHGLVAVCDRRLNPVFVIEKPDGNGGWVATNFKSGLTSETFDGLSIVPDDDAEGYEVETSYRYIPKRPKQTDLTDADEDLKWNWRTLTRGQETGSDYAAEIDRFTRVRITVRRTQTTYTPEEEAVINALGYRVRFILVAQDLVLWEKEVAIPETDGEILVNEDVDLADYGVTSGAHRNRFVVEFRRNGETIRTYEAVAGRGRYTIGEEFDPPTYPVRVLAKGQAADTPWWNDQNGGWETGAKSGGVHLSDDLANCAQMQAQKIRLVVWRNGDLPATYVDGSLTDYPNIDLSEVGTGGMLARIRRTDLTTPNQIEFRETAGAVPFLAAGVLVVPFAVGEQLGGVLAKLDFISGVEGFEINNPTYELQALDAFTAALPSPTLDETVAVPAGSGDNCTIRIRLLSAPPNLVGIYPFDLEEDNDGAVEHIRFKPLRALSGLTYMTGFRLWVDDQNALKLGEITIG